MTTEAFTPLRGQCTCKAVTYEVLAPFLCVNCCHCTWCQRETGAAFALNALIETAHFRITSETKPVTFDIPSASGDGQMLAQCPKCRVALYSDYGGDDGTWMTFVKVGTLDDDSRKSAKPDAHIYTSTKQDWVDLTSEKERGIPVLEGPYRRVNVWSKDALDRYDRLLQKINETKAEKGE